jgi:hypothetical protein
MLGLFWFILFATCFRADVFVGLFFEPEDGSDMFL